VRQIEVRAFEKVQMAVKSYCRDASAAFPGAPGQALAVAPM
jgi:hypothetical protein